ncbi:uncharacterized protein LOC109596240 isoform X2 [Aethina tumida]|uniref:uncharacterized protein LOC109596240 isoform X2 n=1 Tax=Aethina tumida TaxID=116153 RepID=UPI0021478C61|nr:uncharacterized protein LOC109596240 isoform X2 [Aethina tumida]
MSEEKESETPNGVPESPKPLAFTIDFGGEKKIDPVKHQNMIEKYQKRHRRGQSLSKLEEKSASTTPKHPLTGNLPRKSSFQSEGYFSSDEKNERAKSARGTGKRGDLTLQLKNVTMDPRMTQSFPSTELPSIISPDIELKDVSSPELDLISPFSPKVPSDNNEINLSDVKVTASSSDSENIFIESSDDNNFIDGTDFEFDKSDTVSDAGTYTLDADNYSEEQKARMSIDREFKIEQMSVQQKTEQYIRSLAEAREKKIPPLNIKENEVVKAVQMLKLNEETALKSPKSPLGRRSFLPPCSPKLIPVKTLSPITSPTQNISITATLQEKINNSDEVVLNNTFTKIMYPSPKAKNNGLDEFVDQGSVISVTSSGAFRSKSDKPKRKYSLSKSEVQVEAFIDDKPVFNEVTEVKPSRNTPKLTANIVNVQNIEVNKPNISIEGYGKLGTTTNLPPAVGGYSGKNSPTKIPSPIHTYRPRSRGSISHNIDLSDSSLDTENILKPTQNFINSLQQRLSLDSDPDSDFEMKCGMQLNNTAHLLKQRANHIRHNSLDDRTMNVSNKLEHFQNKNLQGIDQTYSNVFNQYGTNRVIHKIQNSPNNSPIRRSSSFTTKNQINTIAKNTNVTQKEVNVCNSPNLGRNTSIQRSSSTACIKPNFLGQRRASVEHQKIDRSQFGDTESSSEDDFEKTLQKRRDLANVTNTRCNRAFSLRRARADSEISGVGKCPNTPEMRRKYQPDAKGERAISVDRKPVRSNEVQSRYLNIAKRSPVPQSTPVRPEPVVAKQTPKTPASAVKKPQAFARTDSGRFSMRTPKPPVANAQKNVKKDSGKKSGGGRSNSSLSSREVEFQNWKRRKSYDPMKAAAEGKRKQELAKKMTQGNAMTQSYTESNHSQDSSPSHSSSVHRSQAGMIL